MKLSERLELAAKYGYAAIPGDHSDLLREAAKLARSVEDAAAADIRDDGKNGGESALLSAATRAGYYQGQRVRIVPDDPTPPPPGHEREGRQSPHCTCTTDPSITCIVHPQEVPDGGR